MNTLTFGSLFAGIGGFDMGMEQAGWECKFQIENDENCQAVLRRHWAHIPKWGDITDVNGTNLPSVDCIIFGSPCQDLSTAGKKMGLNGSKSKLFFEAIRIIKEMRKATNGTFPRWAIWENVAGALNSNKGSDFGQVLDSLAEAGAVDIEWKLLDTKHFGLPQTRRRVFVVSRFFADSREPSVSQIFSVKQSDIRDIQQRSGEDAGSTSKVLFYKTHGKFDQYAINSSPPVKTVSPVCIVTGASKPRALTPVEHERLQGYPDDHTKYRDDGVEQKMNVRYKQCGNGVSTPVAKWVGEQVMKVHRKLNP
jgi:DNA (cytosine-5)-methyltransferase 1